jgi:hypothetical protein
MQRTLIIVGLLILVAGLFWPWVSQVPLGRLPGDIVVNRPGFRFYFPITTMILVSVLISALLWLFRQ